MLMSNRQMSAQSGRHLAALAPTMPPQIVMWLAPAGTPPAGAAPHLWAFQIFGPFLDAHSPGHFALIGCEQGQLSAVIAQGS